MAGKKDIQSAVDAAADMIAEKPRINTYLQNAFDYLEKNPEAHTKEERDGILIFAKYLDGFNVLTNELMILAYQQSAKINREIILGLAEHLPKATVEKVVRDITLKHKHHKVRPKQSGTEA